MKGLVYFFVFLFLASSFLPPSGIAEQSTGTVEFILKSTEEASPEQLGHSADILEKRLKAFGVETTMVTITGSGHISIQVEEASHLDALPGLLTAKGELTFHKVYTMAELLSQQKSPAFMKELGQFVEFEKLQSSVIIGKASVDKIAEVNKLIHTWKKGNRLPDFMDFAWSESAESNNLYNLYACNDTSLVKSNPLSSAEAVIEQYSGMSTILLDFDEGGAKDWARATEVYQGHHIGVMIDGMVYAAPKVAEPITGGKAMITGDFSEKDSKSLAAILSAGSLPIELMLSEIRN